MKQVQEDFRAKKCLQGHKIPKSENLNVKDKYFCPICKTHAYVSFNCSLKPRLSCYCGNINIKAEHGI